MNRRTFLAGVSGASLVGLAGCNAFLGSSVSTGTSEYDIGMGSVFFRPEEFEISAGETVVWANTGNRRHTVTAYDDGIPDEAEFFASGGYENEDAARQAWMDGFGGSIESGQTYEHTFEIPGTYTYLCIPHEPSGMVGRIVVTE